MKHNITKEQLSHEYTELKLDSTQIGKKHNIKKGSVWYLLKKYNIPRRTTRAGGQNIKDLTNKKFGWLTVIKQVINTSTTDSSAKWLCKCNCGNEREVVSGSLISGLTKSCGCRLNSKMWKGYGKLSSSYWCRVKKGASRRNLEFNITMKEAWELFLSQNQKCALSGIDIVIITDYTNKHNQHTASLDRIDSTKGYIKNNIQWVHRKINIMKSNMSDMEFIKMCKTVVDHNKHK